MNTKAFFYFLTGILFLPLVITAQTYSFLREISGNTQQPGLYDFQQPQDLTVDIEGNVFVLDQNYIVKFNSSGSFLKKWKTNGTAHSIAVDKNGYIYITVQSTRTIHKINHNGEHQLSWGGNELFSGVGKITVNSLGLVYVTVPVKKLIHQFDVDGTFINSWGSSGAGNGQFITLGPITCDLDNNIYVLDPELCRIQKFSPQGFYLLKWGSKGSSNGQFGSPCGIATDLAGNVFVLEGKTNGQKVIKFSSTGTYLTSWGKPGALDNEFNNPVVIASNTEVYILDINAKTRVQKCTANGAFLLKWGTHSNENGELNAAGGSVCDEMGNIYVADAANFRVQKFNYSGSFLTKWGTIGYGEGQFNQAAGVARDAEGYVYVVDAGTHRVQKFDSYGNFILQWGSYGAQEGQFNKPYGIAIDKDDHIYVSDVENFRIQKFTTEGVFITAWGSLGVADGQFGKTIIEGKGNALYLTTDAQGFVYVADRENIRIQKFDANGSFILKWTTSDLLIKPIGITSDQQDRILVSDGSGILVFSNSGTKLEHWENSGTENGKFTDHGALSTDLLSNVYVSEPNRVLVYSTNLVSTNTVFSSKISSDKIRISPNPSYLTTTVFFDAIDVLSLGVYNGNGLPVVENMQVKNMTMVELPNLPPGIYLIRIVASTGEYSRTFIRF